VLPVVWVVSGQSSDADGKPVLMPQKERGLASVPTPE